MISGNGIFLNHVQAKIQQKCGWWRKDFQALANLLHGKAMKEKIAIIGTGISGLAAAYALKKAGEDITVFEANNYIGGHSRTIDIDLGDRIHPVDTGFIVFNFPNYPHLTALFDHLGVAYEKSDMSFGVSIDQENGQKLEYSSDHMLLPRNLRQKAYLSMIWEILKFNRLAPHYISEEKNISLGACLDEMKMGAWFREYFLKAMGAAIWSTPAQRIEEYPARAFLQFFKNHGLLTIFDVMQWYTVTGGSRAYVEKITSMFRDDIQLNSPVVAVEKLDEGIALTTKNDVPEMFDQVIFACHADQALSILQNPAQGQEEVLKAFQYQENSIIVHSDESFMPDDRKCWASWVYLSTGEKDQSQQVSLTYWMNNLQNIKSVKPILITLNPQRRPDETLIYDEYDFTHPLFDQAAIEAQEKIATIQGIDNMWFAGAYQRYGFHEDGLLSAVRVLEKMEIALPWT
jgi:predicted NAD/FAD-binding protein